jgi:hypothetical protein
VTYASATDPDARLYRKGPGQGGQAVLHRPRPDGEPRRPLGEHVPDAGRRACPSGWRRFI